MGVLTQEATEVSNSATPTLDATQVLLTTKWLSLKPYYKSLAKMQWTVMESAYPRHRICKCYVKYLNEIYTRKKMCMRHDEIYFWSFIECSCNLQVGFIYMLSSWEYLGSMKKRFKWKWVHFVANKEKAEWQLLDGTSYGMRRINKSPLADQVWWEDVSCVACCVEQHSVVTVSSWTKMTRRGVISTWSDALSR